MSMKVTNGNVPRSPAQNKRKARLICLPHGVQDSRQARRPPPARPIPKARRRLRQICPFGLEGSGVIQLDTFSGMRYTMHESRLDCYAQLHNSVYARVYGGIPELVSPERNEQPRTGKEKR